MYKLLFIDEEDDDIGDFKDYIEEKDLDNLFEVKSIYPLGDLDKMMDEIISYHPDAIVTDYMLNEIKTSIKYNVPYSGTKLVKTFLETREDFPCFVLTSFDDMAIGESDDVNIVYIKGILHGSEKGTKAKATFLDRIKNQIIHYRTKLEIAEARVIELLEKSQNEPLDAPENDELIKLDSLIENALDKKSSISKTAKQQIKSEPLSELLKKVDELAKSLDKKND
jgi:hypothetical protein